MEKDNKKDSISSLEQAISLLGVAKKDFYTLEQAMSLLGLSKRTVEEEIRAGELKAYKRKSRWYILHTDLIAYIKGGKKTA